MDAAAYRDGVVQRHVCEPAAMVSPVLNERDFAEPTPELKAFLGLIGVHWIEEGDVTPEPPKKITRRSFKR